MKIRMTVTVDVDRDDWSHEYGVHPDEVRTDVRNYVAYLIRQADVFVTSAAEVTVQ